MNKADLYQTLIDQLQQELATVTAAAKSSFATATSDAHHAEGKYDTFSLETSYLARGQAKRVAELHDALERLHAQPLKILEADDPAQTGALVRLQNAHGKKRALFFSGAAGGEIIKAAEEEIVVITSQSPLGRAVLGRKAGEHFDITIAGTKETYTILTIE
jgi:transcription elongation GreA/GreB family factor